MAKPKPTLNRRARRLALKADQCLRRKTKIPAGVRKRLELNPGYLKRLAAAHGLEITANGLPRRPVAEGGNASTATAEAAA